MAGDEKVIPHVLAGGLAHGLSIFGILPRRMMDNMDFERDRSEPFSSYLCRENPPDLLVKDYGPAILMVPYFMRRPYDMFLLVKDASKKHLHELTEAEIIAVAEGWHDATRGIHKILPEIGREVAYNVTTSNGPGTGLYFEFLPYSQYFGGFEHLGLFVCQETPDRAASRLRSLLSE
jgi:galactose-1-phosphate uridylyltransferase